MLNDIVRDRGETGLPWGEYGVLYRTHEAGSRIEGMLLQAGVPCRLAAGRALQDDPVVQYLVAALRVIAAPGDPVTEEAFAKVVLPETLYQRIRTEAETAHTEFLEWLRLTARRGQREDPEIKKLRRFQVALDNLHALGRKHTTINGLVDELLAQRVGEYRTLLEERHEELSDPAGDAGCARPGERARPPRCTAAGACGSSDLAGWRSPWRGCCAAAASPAWACSMLVSTWLPATWCSIRVNGPTRVRGSPRSRHCSWRTAGRCPTPSAISWPSTSRPPTRTSRDCEIVEIAGVRVRNGVIVDEFQSLVKPRVPIAPKASEVHGYTAETLRDAPYFEAVWPAFRAFVGDDVLVAHNGHWFDFPILRRMAEPIGGAVDIPVYDTLPLARDLHPGSRRLSDLAEAFGVPLLEAHHALDDARALALVFLRLEQDKLARGPEDGPGQPARLARPGAGAGRLGDTFRRGGTAAQAHPCLGTGALQQLPR